MNAKIISITSSSSSRGDGNSIVTGMPGKPSRPDLKVERRWIPASLGLKFVRRKKNEIFFAFTRHRVICREGVARKKNIASEIKISPATYFRAFPKARRESAFEESYYSDGNLKKVQNEVRTKFLVVSFHVRLSYYRGRKEKKNE